MLGPDDLVLCSGTLRRDVSFRERVDAATAGGFTGISLWGRDYQRARDDGLSDADIRAVLDDHGLGVAELDPAWWWLPGAAAVHIPPELDTEDIFRFDEAATFAIADAVGARSINAVDVFGGEWSIDEATEAFASFCDRAAEHGLLVHLEFLPWSRFPDLETALKVVDDADRANGGLMLDSWHYTRAGTDPDALRLARPRIVAVQLDDGPSEAEDDLVHATLHERRVPGEGGFDLRSFVDLVRGCAPIGVEVFSDELHAMEPRAAAIRAGDATRDILAAGASS